GARAGGVGTGREQGRTAVGAAVDAGLRADGVLPRREHPQRADVDLPREGIRNSPPVSRRTEDAMRGFKLATSLAVNAGLAFAAAGCTTVAPPVRRPAPTLSTGNKPVAPVRPAPAGPMPV